MKESLPSTAQGPELKSKQEYTQLGGSEETAITQIWQQLEEETERKGKGDSRGLWNPVCLVWALILGRAQVDFVIPGWETHLVTTAKRLLETDVSWQEVSSTVANLTLGVSR